MNSEYSIKDTLVGLSNWHANEMRIRYKRLDDPPIMQSIAKLVSEKNVGE